MGLACRRSQTARPIAPSSIQSARSIVRCQGDPTLSPFRDVRPAPPNPPLSPSLLSSTHSTLSHSTVPGAGPPLPECPSPPSVTVRRPPGHQLPPATPPRPVRRPWPQPAAAGKQARPVFRAVGSMGRFAALREGLRPAPEALGGGSGVPILGGRVPVERFGAASLKPSGRRTCLPTTTVFCDSANRRAVPPPALPTLGPCLGRKGNSLGLKVSFSDLRLGLAAELIFPRATFRYPVNMILSKGDATHTALLKY